MIPVRAWIPLLAVLAGCQSAPTRVLPLVPSVDIERFMGDWYVIAATPTFIDREAVDAIESYRREADSSIATSYTFRPAPGAPVSRYTPRGYVLPGTGNAVWEMQFVWPFRADYRIAWLAADYSRVVIAREKRDYAWIMARTPSIPDAQYRQLAGLLAAQGYDISKLRKVPQRWN